MAICPRVPNAGLLMHRVVTERCRMTGRWASGGQIAICPYGRTAIIRRTHGQDADLPRQIPT